eukprot:CAMPEP_0117623426 /NCGR_PEP_ID=MMETSP0784-20121206/88641_1 /TAXON_ID=39447 /ORGANISM="" /LENGTH=268 /DNA_ID=CAMNT_0005427377 /DNA_START=15 /DNA_END=821 /DNA_ORIENTATION=-
MSETRPRESALLQGHEANVHTDDLNIALLRRVHSLLRVSVVLLTCILVGVVLLVARDPADSVNRAPPASELGALPESVSAPAVADWATVLVVYVSEHNGTRALGEAVAAGAARIVGLERGVRLRDAADAHFSDVLWADAVVLGSPTYNAAVHPRLQEFINAWPLAQRHFLRGKLGGSFVTCGGVSAGEELVLASIHASLQIFGFIIAAGPRWSNALGAYSVSRSPEAGNELSHASRKYFLEQGASYGEEVARLAVRLRECPVIKASGV